MASGLSHHAWGILKKYAPLFQACCLIFPRNLLNDLLDRAGEMSVVPIFDICNVYEFVTYDWMHSVLRSDVKMVNMASKIKNWCLFLVWRYNTKLDYYNSMFFVCQLGWFGSVKQQSYACLFKFQKNKLIPTTSA